MLVIPALGRLRSRKASSRPHSEFLSKRMEGRRGGGEEGKKNNKKKKTIDKNFLIRVH
jgi:hypothetical protein